MKKDSFNFEETVSKQHKKNVMNAVQSELAINKQQSSKSFSKLWLSGTLALAFSAVFYFQFLNPVQKSTDLDMAMSENLLMELASLSPEEVEIVEDLDFIEALDSLSPDELEEILL